MNDLSQQTIQRIGLGIVLAVIVGLWAQNLYESSAYISRQSRKELRYGETKLYEKFPHEQVTILLEKLHRPGRDGKNVGYSATYRINSEQKIREYYIEWD